VRSFGIFRAIDRARPHIRGVIVFAAGMASALGALAAAAAVAIALGLYDTRASTQHSMFMAWATHTTFERSVAARASASPDPPPVTGAQLLAGLRQYQRDCAACHGGPGLGRAPWVSGLNPTPPYLLDAGRRWTSSQLYWIIANGVKMTGMPAWRVSRSERQIWELVAFVKALPRIRPDDYARMIAPATRETPAGTP
jgi:mono/diheme cytochrome c family protein